MDRGWAISASSDGNIIAIGESGNNNIKVPGKTEDNTLNIDQAPEGLSKSEYVAWFKKNRK